jgi:hypothetical protein
MVPAHAVSVTEQNPPIEAHFVPLPSSDDGLADLLAEVIPPFSLTLSTPFVRVPVIAAPTFPEADLEEHHKLAVRRWDAGWTPREHERVLGAREIDRETLGGHYERLSADLPWLMVALERFGIEWEAALVLAELITVPALDWFSLDQAANNDGALEPSPVALPALGDPRSPRERVLTPYRRMALTVLADLGAPSTMRTLLGPYPDDENRKPSRLVQAAQVCGVTRSGTANPSRAATNARADGRRLLHALGVWPWVCRADGHLGHEWWADATVVERFRVWLRHEEERDLWARHKRSVAANRAGLK